MVDPLSVEELLRWALSAVLIVAAGSKIVGGRESRLALSSFGVADPRMRAALWIGLIGVEGALGISVAAGVPGAAEVAAGMLALFGIVLTAAFLDGRGGRPCACFGRRSRIGFVAIGRAFLLAAGFTALPHLGGVRPATQTWLAIGLLIALAALALGGVALLALAREIGELRLALGPQSALALDGEGPALGERLELIDRFGGAPELALAFFSSTTCPLCAALRPAIRLVETEPGVEVETFDEQDDRDVWWSLNVPGSPYGVVLDAEGAVLAKGTFNNLGQLESLLAVAERRRAGVAGV
jgi:methylamine utilization protein MauE